MFRGLNTLPFIYLNGLCPFQNTLIPLAGVIGSSDLNSMIEESVKMGKFSHPHVMRLIGVCIDKGASPYIVMPYMIYGSLLSYLKKQRADLTVAKDEDHELVHTYLHIVMYSYTGDV